MCVAQPMTGAGLIDKFFAAFQEGVCKSKSMNRISVTKSSTSDHF